jgi:ribose 5-phosphate isomerase B
MNRFRRVGFAAIELCCSLTTRQQDIWLLNTKGEHKMRVGIATDHGGFGLKQELVAHLREAGHEVLDIGAHSLSPGDDYPDFVIPLAHAVATGKVDRGVATCGSGVGASVCANKIPGIRAGLIHDHFSAQQGVEDDHMNIICMGGRTVGPAVARDLVDTFLAAKFSRDERHLRRLSKVAALEAQAATQ